jgi:hypothetical protein
MSLIETPAFQEFGQRNCADKTQQRPGQRDIKIEVPARKQSEQTAEAYDYDAEYIDGDRPVRCTGAEAYSIQTQKAAYKQSAIKYNHNTTSLFKYPLNEPLKPLCDLPGRLFDVVGPDVNPVYIQESIVGNIDRQCSGSKRNRIGQGRNA